MPGRIPANEIKISTLIFFEINFSENSIILLLLSKSTQNDSSFLEVLAGLSSEKYVDINLLSLLLKELLTIELLAVITIFDFNLTFVELVPLHTISTSLFFKKSILVVSFLKLSFFLKLI